MRQYSLKMDICGSENNWPGSWVSLSPTKNQQFDPNPTSAIRYATISKRMGPTPEFSAVIELFPQRDNQGNTWADRIDVMSTVILQARIGDESKISNHVMFFGFVTRIESSQQNGPEPRESIVLYCRSIDFFLTNPIYAFDRLSDTMASALGISYSLFNVLGGARVAGPLGNILDTILTQSADEIFNTTYVHFPNGSSIPLSNIFSRFIYPYADMILSEGNMTPVAGTYNSIWDVVSSLSETFNGFHFAFVDLVSDSQYNAFDPIYSKAISGNSVKALRPLPISGLSENVYIALNIIPCPFPYLTLPEGTVVAGATSLNGDTSGLRAPLAPITASFEGSLWDALSKNSILSKTVGNEAFSIDTVKDASNIPTAFLLGPNLSASGEMDCNLYPCVVDLPAYRRIGYNPIESSTRFVNAGVTTSPDEQSAMAPLHKFCLMKASFAGAQDYFRSGTVGTILSPDVSIGNVVWLSDIKRKRKRIGYVRGVQHNINPFGANETVMELDRVLFEDEQNNLDVELMSRFVISPLASLTDQLNHRGSLTPLPEYCGDFVQSRLNQ